MFRLAPPTAAGRTLRCVARSASARQFTSPAAFTSDNTRGVLPEVLAAIAAANEAAAAVPAYGADNETQAASQAVRAFLEAPRAAVLPLVSGIASDALAIASAAGPLNAVLCHRMSHVHMWQCGATALFTGGAPLVPLGGDDGKVSPAELARALEAAAAGLGGAVYTHAVSLLSLTQPTEAGTVYTPAEVAALSSLAHKHGLLVHMDGARLTNAVVALGTTAAALTWEAGVDILSFGTTKGGTMAAEAVVVFDPDASLGGSGGGGDGGDEGVDGAPAGLVAATSPSLPSSSGTSGTPCYRPAASLALLDMKRRRKRAGHELSKMRFVSAQIRAFLADGLWRRSAERANAAAATLAVRLSDAAAVEAASHVGGEKGAATTAAATAAPGEGSASLAADVPFIWQHPVQTNQLFLSFPFNARGDALMSALSAVGGVAWDSELEGRLCMRLVTAFDTTEAEIDAAVNAFVKGLQSTGTQ